MSLYNLLHGTNPLSGILLAVLGIDQPVQNVPELPKTAGSWNDNYDPESRESKKYVDECVKRKIWVSGRFRDIYLNEDGTEIILYTRNGGGNRKEYWYIFEILSHHPNYLTDYDDDFDCTYAYIKFSIPEKARGLVGKLVTGEKPKTIFLANPSAGPLS